jgi:dihydroorotase
MLTRRAFLAATGAMACTPRRAFTAARYDLVIKGGRVLDPSRRIDRVADVGIAGGRIRTIETTIANADASDVLDAGGKIVMPGLIDLHVHVNAPELTPATLLGDGVTSMVDGGSAGADNIDALVKIAQAAARPPMLRCSSFARVISSSSTTWTRSAPATESSCRRPS